MSETDLRAASPASAHSSGGGEDPGAVGVLPLLESVARVAGQAPNLLGSLSRLTGALAEVATGRSQIEPARGDRRWKDPTWTDHPSYRRLMQTYLAGCRALDEAIEGADLPDWRLREQARFAAGIAASAMAPTNTLAGNPAALKRALETGGSSLMKGFGHWWDDVRHNGGLPAQVDRSEFVVGRDVAVTPGAVVFRDGLLELIQYTPTTPAVHARPLVVVPPQINKYYIADLVPGRSMIEYAVSRGVTTFAISWRNPDNEHRDQGLDAYAASILSAIDAARAVAGSDDVNVFGLCAGGITLATVLSHLAATGDDRVHAAGFGVTLLDWSEPAMMGAFSSRSALKLTRRQSRGGVFSGGAMASVFTWMRPNDLVWNYWVNNYLLGNTPEPFDILAWNNDKTNLPGRLHDQFLRVFAENLLAHPGSLTVLGSPVDLSRVTIDTYVAAGVTDHITPWRGCYLSTGLFGGRATFVLANSGHVQTLISPIESTKARYWAGPTPGPDAEAWKAQAEERSGSWWRDWMDWVVTRSGPKREAPRQLGNPDHPPLADAPGEYVHG